ncbi:MAG: gliding motility-associated C-terminal domain-containing protein [Cyclobacteriaceae bacterium]
MIRLKTLFVALFSVMLVLAVRPQAFATHLRAGEIIVTRNGCTSNEYTICITVYTNVNSPIRFGESPLDFGDGSEPLTTPRLENGTAPGLPANVGTVTFCTTHTYSAPGHYIIRYREPNRNAGILNMANSVGTEFYLETELVIDNLAGCNNTPRLLVPPIDKGCTGAAWFHNPGAYDIDGDSLSFEMVVPKQDKGVFVNNYVDPNAEPFYSAIGIDYNQANEDRDGTPLFAIDPVTGTITWDAPGEVGEYNIAFLIKEYRKINGTWVQLGYVTRDMQIVIEDCDNHHPELELPADICVEAGTLITEDIFATDPDGNPVSISAFSQVLELPVSKATYTPNSSQTPVFQPTSNGQKAKVTFRWQTDCSHVRQQPYQVVFKAIDNPATGPRLIDFKTFNITVVAPAPKWQAASLDAPTRTATLTWEPYTCASSASIMQVWRRVDSFPFTPPVCVTGMPDFLGYVKIAEVPIGQTTYLDNNNGRGLASGAKFCYRLVAGFTSLLGGDNFDAVSYVSDEICLPPIDITEAVITNVSVVKTGKPDGEIEIKWRSPIGANKIQNPPPYSFELYRAEGISGDRNLIITHPGKLTDSTFTDKGLNTQELIYNYRVISFDKNGNRMDTSRYASAVRLETQPQKQEVGLQWVADVPWSNNSSNFPYHLIYRGGANATENDLVLIDSVNVLQNQYRYTDTGLDENQTYCYRVQTRGSFGNAAIAAPLKNFSEIICAQASSAEKPCAPTLSIVPLDCPTFLATTNCNFNTYSNTLYWPRPTEINCIANLRYYRVYFSTTQDGDFFLLADNVVDTFFVDNNLPSFARCYKITAVDRSGTESEFSNQVCNDNCPNFQLPNVFTPGNGDDCNDTFSAYREPELGEGSTTKCGNIVVTPDYLKSIRQLCPRFVTKVSFSVLNRWGKEVYSYESLGENSIYIDWDGNDSNGKELPAGIYYYSAQVTFVTLDPAQSHKTIKGWVSLVRAD